MEENHVGLVGTDSMVEACAGTSGLEPGRAGGAERAGVLEQVSSGKVADATCGKVADTTCGKVFADGTGSVDD